eukprot:TRINITY_DN67621_c0_g1_i1.p1 TRINITY_DN67621_c0_g1~~TRINITY_DN67621_c0_g1_i1.p1  ORF type:complete len:712 (-),score=115.89 TRINITY_DN67621_c0_g1_i1:95-2191(-)
MASATASTSSSVDFLRLCNQVGGLHEMVVTVMTRLVDLEAVLTGLIRMQDGAKELCSTVSRHEADIDTLRLQVQSILQSSLCAPETVAPTASVPPTPQFGDCSIGDAGWSVACTDGQRGQLTLTVETADVPWPSALSSPPSLCNGALTSKEENEFRDAQLPSDSTPAKFSAAAGASAACETADFASEDAASDDAFELAASEVSTEIGGMSHSDCQDLNSPFTPAVIGGFCKLSMTASKALEAVSEEETVVLDEDTDIEKSTTVHPVGKNAADGSGFGGGAELITAIQTGDVAEALLQLGNADVLDSLGSGGASRFCDAVFKAFNTSDSLGRTALHLAAGHGLLSVCQALLDHRVFACQSAADAEARTALHHAASRGHTEICLGLLDHCRFTSTDAVDKDGRTALHCAAAAGHAETVKALLDHGRFTVANATDHLAFTALHCAARGGHDRACRVLIDHGSFKELYAKNAAGCTALQCAMLRGDARVCRVLLEHPRFVREMASEAGAADLALLDDLASLGLGVQQKSRPEVTHTRSSKSFALRENGGSVSSQGGNCVAANGRRPTAPETVAVNLFSPAKIPGGEEDRIRSPPRQSPRPSRHSLPTTPPPPRLSGALQPRTPRVRPGSPATTSLSSGGFVGASSSSASNTREPSSTALCVTPRSRATVADTPCSPSAAERLRSTPKSGGGRSYSEIYAHAK